MYRRQPLSVISGAVAILGLMIILVTSCSPPTPTLKSPVQVEYIGRVVDSKNLQPIENAQVSLDVEGVPPIVYTDSEGIYRFTLALDSAISAQVRVNAPNYQPYARNITVDPADTSIEDIRLDPLEMDATPTTLPRATITPDPTLIAMFALASTPNANFVIESRSVDGIEQVWVPEGSFVAGDISGIGYEDEKPLHSVYTDGFWIDRNLVTNEQYASCPRPTCSDPQKLSSHVRPNGYYGVPAFKDYPVIHITWQQAVDFCAWRGGRLPTEAEFEKAAGWDPLTGQTYIYPWGNEAPTDQLANYNGIDRDTRPVGSYPQGVSPTGAYDMAGNVWEWVSDWYSETYYSDNQEWRNPTGPTNGAEKVLRGGSWFSADTRWLRASNRGKSVPDKVANEFGFRCVFER